MGIENFNGWRVSNTVASGNWYCQPLLSTLPGFNGIWTGVNAAVGASRTILNCMLGNDADLGVTFLNALPTTASGNIADVKIGFFGTNTPTFWCHLSSSAVKGIRFFPGVGDAAAAQQAITGALSTVTDAAAKAVLTSIITALTNYGLTTNGTT